MHEILNKIIKRIKSTTQIIKKGEINKNPKDKDWAITTKFTKNPTIKPPIVIIQLINIIIIDFFS